MTQYQHNYNKKTNSHWVKETIFIICSKEAHSNIQHLHSLVKQDQCEIDI